MICSRCKQEHQDGSEVFSPSYLDNQVIRYWICRACWVPLLHYVQGYAVNVVDASPHAPKVSEPHAKLWRAEWENISEVARILQNKVNTLRSCLPELKTMISMCKEGSDFHDILTIIKEKIEK